MAKSELMDTPNNILYQLFSAVNFVGCIYAIYRLYCYFSPHKQILPQIVRYVNFMLLCLFMFTVYQLAALANPILDLPWQMKIGVTMFWIKSVYFNDVVEKLVKLLQGRNQIGS